MFHVETLAFFVAQRICGSWDAQEVPKRSWDAQEVRITSKDKLQGIAPGLFGRGCRTGLK